MIKKLDQEVLSIINNARLYPVHVKTDFMKKVASALEEVVFSKFDPFLIKLNSIPRIEKPVTDDQVKEARYEVSDNLSITHIIVPNTITTLDCLALEVLDTKKRVVERVNGLATGYSRDTWLRDLNSWTRYNYSKDGNVERYTHLGLAPVQIQSLKTLHFSEGTLLEGAHIHFFGPRYIGNYRVTLTKKTNIPGVWAKLMYSDCVDEVAECLRKKTKKEPLPTVLIYCCCTVTEIPQKENCYHQKDRLTWPETQRTDKPKEPNFDEYGREDWSQMSFGYQKPEIILKKLQNKVLLSQATAMAEFPLEIKPEEFIPPIINSALSH